MTEEKVIMGEADVAWVGKTHRITSLWAAVPFVSHKLTDICKFANRSCFLVSKLKILLKFLSSFISVSVSMFFFVLQSLKMRGPEASQESTAAFSSNPLLESLGRKASVLTLQEPQCSQRSQPLIGFVLFHLFIWGSAFKNTVSLFLLIINVCEMFMIYSIVQKLKFIKNWNVVEYEVMTTNCSFHG